MLPISIQSGRSFTTHSVMYTEQERLLLVEIGLLHNQGSCLFHLSQIIKVFLLLSVGQCSG